MTEEAILTRDAMTPVTPAHTHTFLPTGVKYKSKCAYASPAADGVTRGVWDTTGCLVGSPAGRHTHTQTPLLTPPTHTYTHIHSPSPTHTHTLCDTHTHTHKQHPSLLPEIHSPTNWQACSGSGKTACIIHQDTVLLFPASHGKVAPHLPWALTQVNCQTTGQC